eukprot:15224291-Alexandrium_andersonii.AAC.1
MVLAHVDGAQTEPPTAFLGREQRRELRQALLGPAAESWARDGPGPKPSGRAVLLIDQSKAFERLAPAWIEA